MSDPDNMTWYFYLDGPVDEAKVESELRDLLRSIEWVPTGTPVEEAVGVLANMALQGRRDTMDHGLGPGLFPSMEGFIVFVDRMAPSDQKKVQEDPGRGTFRIGLDGDEYGGIGTLFSTFPEMAHGLLPVFGVVAQSLGASFAMAFSDLMEEHMYETRSWNVGPSFGRSWFKRMIKNSQDTFYVDDGLMDALDIERVRTWCRQVRGLPGGGHLLWGDTPFGHIFRFDRVKETPPFGEFLDTVADRVYGKDNLAYL